MTQLTMEQVRDAAASGGWCTIADAGRFLSVGRGRTTVQVSFAGDGRFIHASSTEGLDGMAQVVIEPMVIAELLSADATQSAAVGEQRDPVSSEEKTT